MQTKLEKLKEAFSKYNLEISRLAHHSYCMLELGKSYRPTIDMLDDLYTRFVSGGINNTLIDLDGGPPENEKLQQVDYTKLLFSLVEMGTTYVFPYDEWVKQYPESDEWAIWIEASLVLEDEYLKNPENWLLNFRKKLNKSKFNN